MHVPTVTDEMLDRVVDAAASPVFVLFFEADSTESARLMRRIESVAEDFDDRVIFLCVNADENPTPARARGVQECPAIVILKRGRDVGRAVGDVARDSIEELLERAITTSP